MLSQDLSLGLSGVSTLAPKALLSVTKAQSKTWRLILSQDPALGVRVVQIIFVIILLGFAMWTEDNPEQ